MSGFKFIIVSPVLLAVWLVGQSTGFAQYVVSWGCCPGVVGLSTGVVAVAGETLTNVSMVAAGDYHALALKKDGTLVGWGDDRFGQATGPAIVSSERAIAILPRQAATNIAAISAGMTFSLALRQDGTVLGWGAIPEPIICKGRRATLASLTNVVAVSGRGRHALALKRDGTVVLCWGDAMPPVGLSNIAAIAASVDGMRDLALTRDGTVMGWSGWYGKPYGVAKPCPGLSNVVAIATGGGGPGQCYALKKDGTVATWNRYAEVATNIPGFENVVAIAAGGETMPYSTFCLALKRDGTLAIHSEYNYQLVPVTLPEGLSNVVSIAVGSAYCLAVTTNWAVAEKYLHK